MSEMVMHGGPELLPGGIPLESKNVILLPYFLSDGDAIFSEHTTTVMKLLREADVGVQQLQPVLHKQVYRAEYGVEWVLPVIFIPLAAFVDNPHVLSVTLNVISNYLTDIFRVGAAQKSLDGPTCKLKVISEIVSGKEYLAVDYVGPNLNGVADVIEAARKPRSN